MTTFNFNVRINNSSLLADGYGQIFVKPDEIYVVSEDFTDYKACEQHLSKAMAYLVKWESKASNDPHVVVSRLNPIISGKDTTEIWDNNSVLRAYIASAQKLKDNDLSYSITATITSSDELKSNTYKIN